VVDHLGLAVSSGLRELLMVELLELSADGAHEVLVDIDGDRSLWASGDDGVALSGHRVLHPGSGDRNRYRKGTRLVAVLQPQPDPDDNGEHDDDDDPRDHSAATTAAPAGRRHRPRPLPLTLVLALLAAAHDTPPLAHLTGLPAVLHCAPGSARIHPSRLSAVLGRTTSHNASSHVPTSRASSWG
jgi:hypothetical protein